MNKYLNQEMIDIWCIDLLNLIQFSRFKSIRCLFLGSLQDNVYNKAVNGSSKCLEFLKDWEFLTASLHTTISNIYESKQLYITEAQK